MFRPGYLVLVLSVAAATAAEPPTTPAPTPAPDPAARWTVDDIVQAERIEDFEISPDGTRAVWVRTGPHPDKDESLSHLYLTRLATGEEIQLTRGRVGASNPRWSPDGLRIAFATARPDPDGKGTPPGDGDDEPKPQIWILNLAGGEPYPVSRSPRGVRQFEWRGTNSLVFSAQEDPSQLEAERKEKKDRTVVTEDDPNEPPVRLFEVGLDRKPSRRLTRNLDRIAKFSVSPEGTRVLALHDRSLRFEYDQRIRPALWLHSLEDARATPLLGDAPPLISGFAWARDGRHAYLVVARASHPVYRHASVLEPYLLDTSHGLLSSLPLAWDRGLTDSVAMNSSGRTGLAPTPDGFVALAADGTKVRLVRMTRDGAVWRSIRVGGEHAEHLAGLSVATNGTTAIYLHSRANRLPQLQVARLGRDVLESPRAVTRLNETLAAKPVGDVEIVRWPGARRAEIEGILFKPPGFRPDRAHPLVLMIHGGPHSVDLDRWDHSWAYAPALFTQRGALVLQPNYQGSSSYGLPFSEAIADGKYYDLPVEDILKGIDHLVARGNVDTNRLGTLGWSNGAILTMALVTRDPRFKAASAGAGGVEWTADTAACVFGLSFNDYYFGATPWADPERYRQLSPYWRMHQVTTPVLLFQGTADDIVPPHHAWMQFRLLQEYRKAPVRFVQLPEEPHSLGRPSSQRRKLEEELAWFDRHLFAAVPAIDPAPALKQNSRLALALQRASARRVGNRFGEHFQGRLIPETVPLEGLLVGRFEVTRAQFAEFAPAQPPEPGRENHPAAGVSFATAQAYCQWLSQLTGQSWRLPNAAEARSLYPPPDADAPESGNTLDHWAGYPPNPEDADRLLRESEKLGGPGALLLEVGSFPGRGDPDTPPVFDLDGNVAEWTLDDAGQASSRGGSADTPARPGTDVLRASPACQGFRVIRSPATPAGPVPPSR